MTDSILIKNPIAYAIGFLFLFSIAACQFVKTPAETTLAFWSAIAANDLELAKKYCSSQSLQLLSSSEHQALQNVEFSYGKIVLDGDQATVETKIVQAEDKKSSFTTFLLKEDDQWKVDYQRSVKDLAGDPVSELFKSLNTLGQTFKKRLEQQIPYIKKEVESFGEKFKERMDSMENELKKPSSELNENSDQEVI